LLLCAIPAKKEVMVAGGNAMSTPVIGAVLASVLVNLASIPAWPLQRRQLHSDENQVVQQAWQKLNRAFQTQIAWLDAKKHVYEDASKKLRRTRARLV
jgi:proline dehydrogenase